MSVENKDLVDQLGHAIAAANEVVKKHDELTSYQKEKIDKIADDSYQTMEKLRKLELKMENEEYASLRNKLSNESFSSDYEIKSKEHSLELKSFFDHKNPSAIKPTPTSIVREHQLYDPYSRGMRSIELKGLDAVSYDNAVATIDRSFKHLTPTEKAKELDNLVSAIVEKKSWMIGNNPAGGYFLRPEWADWFILRAYEINEVRSYCTVRTTTSLENLIVIRDDTTLYSQWANETSYRGATQTPKIGLARVTLDNLYIKPALTEKFFHFATTGNESVEQFIVDYSRTDMLMNEASAMINGDGNASVLGILSYPAWPGNGPTNYQKGALERVTAAGATITYDDIVNLMSSLNNKYSSNAAFYCNRFTWGQLLQIKSTTGFPLINPNALGEGASHLLMGYPLRILNQMPSVASGSQPLIFGDLKAGYTIFDYPVVTMFRDIYTQVPFINYYMSKYVASAVTAYDSIKILVMP